MCRTGATLVIGSALVILTNAAAARLYPAQWGGPNIGAGGINLLAVLGAVVGAVLVVRGRRHGAD